MIGIEIGRTETLAEVIIGEGCLFSRSFVVAASLEKFLGHQKYIVVDNSVTGSVLVKFEEASDMQKVDGLLFRTGAAGPFRIRKVHFVQAQANDYSDLFVVSAIKSDI